MAIVAPVLITIHFVVAVVPDGGGEVQVEAATSASKVVRLLDKTSAAPGSRLGSERAVYYTSY
jgi:hypothetical protein